MIPLATLLGLAERPGEGHGLGVLDPWLCRALAAAAAASGLTRLCVTVTGPGGIAIGHGCARPSRKSQAGLSSAPSGATGGLPSRVNLTIPADLLAALADMPPQPGPSRPRAPAGWALARVSESGRPGDPGDPGDSDPPGVPGTWNLTLPGGRVLTVRIEDVPVLDCDHHHESHAYQPNAALRHLVQVRDGECTFPTCSRHARESDFEHAVPYHAGGRTCACNAGARSRQCHQVKQSPGWNLTQPRPGWHQWTTPAGRTYTQGPKQYPV